MQVPHITKSPCLNVRQQQVQAVQRDFYGKDSLIDCPLGSLRRSLIFHCYPYTGADWRSVCWKTFQYRKAFNGRVLVTIVTGKSCEDSQQVVKWFAPFDVEFSFVENNQSMGLNTSFRQQLRSVQQETGIVFKSHTKGITHLREGLGYSIWLNNLVRGCLGNLELVEEKFREGYLTFGAFKTTTDEGEKVVNHTEKRWKGWHYPGALFWFDPKSIPNSFFNSRMHHYENEELPCIIGPTETGFSLTPDNQSFWRPLCLPW